MKSLIREPLVHFLLLGAALFALNAALQDSSQSRPSEIVVTPGLIEHLADKFKEDWRRPPTSEELKELVDQFVRQEVLNREAIKLGLDQNDTVIRERLQQKMESLVEDHSVDFESDALQEETNREDFEDLLAKYQVTIQWPGEQTASKSNTSTTP